MLRLRHFDPANGGADDLVYLSARFCDALADSLAFEDLRNRAGSFDRVTGRGSAFDNARRELSRLCGGEAPSPAEAVAEQSVWSPLQIRLTLASLRETYGNRLLAPDGAATSPAGPVSRPSLPAEAQDRSVLLRWWCAGPETIHDAEWVRCNLHTVFAITECAVQSGFEFYPLEVNAALSEFRDQVWNVWRQADREHLLGAYLLAACYDAVNAGRAQCQNLFENLTELDVQARTVCEAAEDLCRRLADSLAKLPGTVIPPADAGSVGRSTIGEVIVSFSGKCCVLRVAGHQAFVMTEDETCLFVPLVALVATETATGYVPWEAVSRSIGQEAPEWRSKQHPEAAKGFSLLNQRLREWGRPPDEQDWIATERGKKGGRRLNKSVRWVPDAENEIIRSLARKTTSVSGPLINPHTMETATPDGEHRLPSRRRHKPIREDDQDEDG